MLEKMQVDRFLGFSKPSGDGPVHSHPENTTTTKNGIEHKATPNLFIFAIIFLY